MRILTEQEETLVFNDICARLPYDIKVAELIGEKPEGAYKVISINKDKKNRCL